MSSARRLQSVARSAARPAIGAIAILLVLSSSACRGHTAAGCGAGLAVGMLLGALSAGVADDPSIDVGSGLLGGGLFGIAAGCTGAATVDAMTRSKEKVEPLPPPEPLYPTRAAAPPPSSPPAAQPQQAAQTPGVIKETTELDGLRVLWVGHPQRYPTKVGVRFERFTRDPVLVDCTALELTVDGRQLRFELVGKATPQGMLVRESAQSTLELEVVRELRGAGSVELQLCGLRRRLTTRAADQLASFVTQFDALALPAAVTPAPPPVEGTTPELAAPTASATPATPVAPDAASATPAAAAPLPAAAPPATPPAQAP
jgi:hypothetical protein